MEIYFYSSGVRREAVMKNHMQISSLKMFLVSVGFLKNTIIISDIRDGDSTAVKTVCSLFT